MRRPAATADPRPPGQEIRRRKVFYLPGYDPIHPRRYRELYRREGRAQARISGYLLDLTGRPAGGRGAAPRAASDEAYGWRVTSVQEGAEVVTEVEVLVWSDIVRTSMDRGIAGTYAVMVRTAWVYLSTGALARLMRLRKGPVIAALYPIGMLLLQAVAAVFAGLLAGLLATWAMRWLGLGAGGGTGQAGLQWLAATLFGLVTGGAVLRHFRNVDNRLYVYYLMHDYAYSATSRGAHTPEMEARLRRFAARIAAALEAEDGEAVDEVLVVGHSSGAALAVSVLADLHRAGRIPGAGPRLGLLTLGQVVPMVSFLPEAHRLRADLAYLSAADIPWVDVTAPGDGCTFALCDPVAVSGVAPAGKRWPLVVSAAFTRTLSPERWRQLRWRFFRLHFQYLCAFDRPGDYDYFRITAGPLSLATRFRDRPPSASRIETPVSKHTGIAR